MNWNTLTIGQYQRIYTLQKRKPADELEELEILAATLSEITGRSVQEIESMNRQQLRELSRAAEFLNTMPEPSLPPRSVAYGWRSANLLVSIGRATVGKVLFDLRNLKDEPDGVARLHRVVCAFIIHPWYRRLWWRIAPARGRAAALRIEERIRENCPYIVAYNILHFFIEVREGLGLAVALGSLETYHAQLKAEADATNG